LRRNRAELRRQPDALRLSAAQRRRRAVERQVRKPHPLEERQPAAQLRQDVARDLGLASAQLQPAEEALGDFDRQRR
jgi:hypothetical protein